MGWEVAERKSFKVADLASPGSLLERVFVSSQLLSPGVADPLGKWFGRATAVTEWHSEAAIDAHSVRKSDVLYVLCATVFLRSSKVPFPEKPALGP